MSKRSAVNFYPPIKPYFSGHLHIEDGHKLYYEECGNRNGFPLLYVHGGPGSGCDADARRFFDPKKWRIILFDQRGAGRSTPYASTHANTTQHLVGDMRKLLRILGVEKAVLFGGSWGSTLSLCYAIEHPQTVAGMVLRGIFLATKEEQKDYLRGISQTCFPHVWDRFIANVPARHRSRPGNYYYQKMLCGTPKEIRFFAYEWAYYETARLRLKPPTEAELRKEILEDNFVSLATLEAHYIINCCFIKEGHILAGAHRIPDVPISIIHGMYDDVCPAKSATDLAKALPRARFHLAVAGHSRTDPRIKEKLITETNEVYKLLQKRAR